MRRPANKLSLIMDTHPHSAAAEDYRTLRANIQFSTFDNKVHMIAVASPESGEGRTTTAINLAIAFAQTNKRVLLVDGDLRKPCIHDVFNKPNTGGLTNLIANQSGARGLIQDTHVANLSLLCSGPAAPNPAELLSSERLTELLDELRGLFDMIVIDTPPANQVSDAQIVAAQCDGVLMVVQANKTKRQSVAKAKESLQLVKARLLGYVLNNKKAGKNGKTYEYA